MKKLTLLVSAFALVAGTMSAKTLQVTTTEMNAATEGSLLHVMANLASGEVNTIEFNFDGNLLDYSAEECIGFKLDASQQIVFDGINKKNNTMVTINGNTNFLDMKSGAEVTINKMKVTGFKGVAFKTADGSKLTLNNCVFESNRDPKNEKGNNGSILRAGGGNIVVDGCLFEKNKAMGSYGGGALCLYQSSATAPSMRVVNSTFLMNEAESGGAIAVNVRSGNGSVPTVYIANCTFANNMVNNRGGAIYMQTAEVAGVFKPVIVNNTFVGNITNIVTSDDGGAINLWSRATTTMEPILVNNLFAENYYNPWDVELHANDVKAFYLGGEIVGDKEQPQTVKPIVKNNFFAAANDTFYQSLSKADNNDIIDFNTDNIFAATEQNPWDEGDPEYHHKTAKLSGDLKVAMISNESIATGMGATSVDGVEIPKKDQLGNDRPSVPSIGAVEYTNMGSVAQIETNTTAIVKQGDIISVSENATLYIYNISGSLINTVKVEAGETVSIAELQAGLYFAKAGDCVLKFVK